MAVCSSRGTKRKMATKDLKLPPELNKVTLLSPTQLLLEIPSKVNISLPVWDAIRSQHVDITWTSNPYHLSVHITPVIINQPQPATDNEVNQTPTPVKPELQEPVPSPFYIKARSDILICDKFLLNKCRFGKKCKMHHTPYPFHWQLWCVDTHEWVDVPLRSQVFIERLYCNVDEDTIDINVSSMHYTLNFDSLELSAPLELQKHNSMRRLTNTDCRLRNPYFPTEWKIYWCDFNEWFEYNKDVSTLLLKTKKEKKSECSFVINVQEYKLDFTTMTQTNVTTGYQRRVRCRPVYRSPDSMQPHLQTGLQMDPAGDPPGANFSVDPLEEFSSWYPPVWRLGTEDEREEFSLVDVPVGTRTYRSIYSLFHESIPETEVDIISIQQVQNLLHWDKYQRQKTYMQQRSTSQQPLERHLFHGTNQEASESICRNNFDPRVSGINGSNYGSGSYFATTASYSSSYSNRGRVCHMFLAKVLVGQSTRGKFKYCRPPPLSKKSQYLFYDSCVDKLDHPTMFVVFDSCQCYPYYLIKYNQLLSVVEF